MVRISHLARSLLIPQVVLMKLFYHFLHCSMLSQEEAVLNIFAHCVFPEILERDVRTEP